MRKLKEIMEEKISDLTFLVEYKTTDCYGEKHHFCYARYVEDLDKDNNRPFDRITSWAKCDFCGAEKDYFKKEITVYYDFKEFFYCANCHLETVEGLIDKDKEEKEKKSFYKLCDIFNNKITTVNLYKYDQFDNRHNKYYARYE